MLGIYHHLFRENDVKEGIIKTSSPQPFAQACFPVSATKYIFQSDFLTALPAIYLPSA